MSQESNSATGICRIYASGKTCRFGNNCRYRHSRNKQYEELKGTYEDSPGGEEVTRELCSQYARTRFCKFGARCRYSHRLPQNFNLRQDAQHDGSLNQEVDQDQSSTAAGNRQATPYFSLPLPKRKDVPRKNLNGNDDEVYDDNGHVQKTNPDGSNVIPSQDQQQRRKHYNVRGRGARRGHGRFVARTNRPLPGADSQKHQQFDSPSVDDEVLSADVPVNKSAKAEKEDESKKNSDQKNQQRTRRRRICRYFKAGHCTMGDRCRFWHPITQGLEGDGENKENCTPVVKPVRVVFSRPNEFELENFMEGESEKLRKKEIDHILRRYPKAEAVGTDTQGTWSCELKFIPTDPDWVYDVKEVLLKIIIPSTYPLMPMSALLTGEQEQMPNTLVRYTAKSIKEWLTTRFADYKAKGKGELMFQPFTRWLDRNIERIFTEGLKLYKREMVAAAAGIQLISGAELQEEYAQKQASSEDDEQDDDDDDNDDDDDEDDEDDFPAAQPSHVGELPPYGSVGDPSSLDAIRKGTEVKFQKLDLAENASTLKLMKVKVIVQCSRCKDKAEVLTPCGKVNHVICAKCSQGMLVLFRTNMVHQFSAIAGYMDLENCVAFDLVLMDCLFEIGCFNCSRDMRMEGLLAGQPKETFCHHCHKKIRIATESVRFQQLQAANVLDVSDAQVLQAMKKSKKLPKDPAIQPGKPLPSEGTCKHYKKSFRWLRFPCCGKAFPCDVCHDDNEGDHEMIWANRMICGFCCREQPFSAEKPCVECGYNLIKKSSAHWEGGRGCRDKIKMSRDDDKKFTNMNKTTSRRSQAKKDTKGKKATKLRHV